ncbi:MAG: universal stress protein [Anaerolineales bacterium]|nr:universal stress protein [Anaerolineales bacterium]
MFKTVLLGVDGSEHALRAASLAGELARCMRADLWVVVCFDPIPAYLGHPNVHNAITERMQQAEQILQPALEAVGETPGFVKTEMLEGPPAEAILAVAVMGTRGLGRLGGLVLGSQSQKVLANAACPVLLVK